MKKRLFFLPMVAIMMAACSSNETIEVNENKGDLISFRPIVKGVTRAADVSTDNLTSFIVNAKKSGGEISYFDNCEFNKSGSVYVSESKYYWPASGSLDFYAYSPAGNTQVNYSGYKTFTVTPSTAIADQVDFVFAATKDKNKEDCGASGVTLNFRHTGAKIACKVKNSSTTLKFDVCGWKVGYICPAATFTFSDANTDGNNDGSGTTLTLPQWGNRTAASIGTEYESTFSENQIGQSGATSLDGEMILIPQAITAASGYASASAGANLNGTYIAVKLKIRNNDSAGTIIADDGADGAFWAIWPIGGYNWEPGKKYTYTIDLAGGGYYETNQDGTDGNLDAILEGAEIKFVSVSVDGWTDVEKSPAVNLAILKGMAKTNLSEAQAYADGNYYVDKDGNIHSSSETGYTTLDEAKGSGATGIIAYISNTDLTWDDGVNGGNGLTSQNSISFTGKNILILSSYFLALDGYYGFDLNNTLIDTSITGGSDAAHYAKPVNSTVWFVPSKSQMISMGCAASGAWSGVGQKYLRSTSEKWTSTKFDESSLWALDYNNTYERVTTNNGRRVTPCYAY